MINVSGRSEQSMSSSNAKKRDIPNKKDDSSLKGTLASVFMLGGFIIVTWFIVWFLFVSRF